MNEHSFHQQGTAVPDETAPAPVAPLAPGAAGGTYTPSQAPNAPQRPATPPARACQWDRLPAALRERPQWLLAGPDGKGSFKIPQSVGSSGQAYPCNTTPTGWMSFERACAEAEARGYLIGFELTEEDPFACIDIDPKASDSPEDADRYSSIIEQFDSYTERSQSGRGVHIWCLGKFGPGRRRDGVEVYSQNRFIVCTGDALRDVPLQSRQALLDGMASQMAAAAGPTIELEEHEATEGDDALLGRARAAANSEKFSRLWAGEWRLLGYPSQSEADLALMGMLAFYSRSDEQCRRLFRQSGLGTRDKALRDDYVDNMLKLIRGRQTCEWGGGSIEHGERVAAAILATALQKMKQGPAVEAERERWLTVGVADVCTNPEPPIEFLVEDLLPAREVTLLPADGGAGKSLLTLIAAVCQAMGLPFMGKAVTRSKVIFFSGEDDARVLRGRLRRVCEQYEVNPAELADWLQVIDATDSPTLFTELYEANEGTRGVPTRNLEELERRMGEWRARVIVIDNASDTYDANENVRQFVRGFVRGLKDIAKKHDAAIWLLAHLDKASVRGDGGKAKFSGSTAWHNSVRSRLLLVPHPEKPDHLVLSQEKSNHGRRSAEIELAWTPEGVLVHAGGGVRQSVPTPEELQQSILGLIRSRYERGQYISTSLAPNAPSGAYATLIADPAYPRHLSKAQLATLLRQARDGGQLEAESYRHPTRRHVEERWRVV